MGTIGNDTIWEYTDTIPHPDLIDNFYAYDINHDRFELYDELLKKPVIMLYIDVVSNPSYVKALEQYNKNIDKKYSSVIINSGNDKEKLKKVIDSCDFSSRFFYDSTKTLYTNLEIKHIPSTIVVGKDIFIKAFIKRDMPSVESYEEMLKGVLDWKTKREKTHLLA